MISSFTLKRYHTENRNLLYGDFKFGPLFMRLCYELGLEGMAAATITDEVRIVTMEVATVMKCDFTQIGDVSSIFAQNMKGFFIDTTSFNITIDMLFIKGSYESE